MDTATNSERNSSQARQELRRMQQTTEAVLRLLLIEAGVAYVDMPGRPYPKLVKTGNNAVNQGRTPEMALSVVAMRHLSEKWK